MTGLISDLLDVEKLESGRIEMSKEPTNIGTVLKEVSDTLSGLAEKNNLAVKINLPNEPIIAVVDPRRLHQVIANLFSNSIKYTPEGEVGGTGPGLSIVKSIVDLHQGSVSVESARGDGSRFIVSIPLGFS